MAIELQTEEKVAGILGLLGLLTGLISAMNQLLRLWQWREEAQEKASQPSLAEELTALEAQVKALTLRLEMLQQEAQQDPS